MANYKKYILILLLISSIYSFAQTGGMYAYPFLNQPNSARLSALGGNAFPVNDSDITLAYTNPSLIKASMHNQIALSYVDYFSDINAGFIGYGFSHKKAGNFVATLQFINYGKFTETDATGIELGQFSGGEYALNVGWARPLAKNLSIGANLKNIFSQLEQYTSYGIAVDVASTYFVPEKEIGISLIAKNIGRQITTYNHSGVEPLPFDIQLSFSKRLEHLPFRFILSIDKLHKWNLAYNDPNAAVEIDPFTGEEIKQNNAAKTFDLIARHFVFGGEFAPGKGNFAIRLGYDYNRRQEMKVDTRKAMTGFSWGFGFKISRFNLSYARSSQHLASGVNTFTITSKL